MIIAVMKCALVRLHGSSNCSAEFANRFRTYSVESSGGCAIRSVPNVFSTNSNAALHAAAYCSNTKTGGETREVRAAS